MTKPIKSNKNNNYNDYKYFKNNKFKILQISHIRTYQQRKHDIITGTSESKMP